MTKRKANDGGGVPVVDEYDLEYRRIMEEMLERESYTCDLCDERFPSKSALSLHQIGHVNGLYRCGLCKERFDTKLELGLHKKDKHSEHSDDLPVDRYPFFQDNSPRAELYGTGSYTTLDMETRLGETSSSVLLTLSPPFSFGLDLGLEIELELNSDSDLDSDSDSDFGCWPIWIDEEMEWAYETLPQPKSHIADMSDEIFSGRNTQYSPKESFRYHAEKALLKLKSPSWQNRYEHPSVEYLAFVYELGNVDDVIHSGCQTLIDFLNTKVPQTLSQLYCMLHVCYAISKSSSKDNPRMTEEAFSKSVKDWKYCLPVVSEAGVREQDLFDEIQSVMWEEIKEAFEYVEDLLGRFENQQPNQRQQSCYNLDFLNLDFLGDYDEPEEPKVCTDPPNDNEPPDISGHQSPMPSKKSIIANPLESTPPLSPPLASWDILFPNAIIKMALEFFKELGETSIVLLCACGSILQTVFGSLETGTSMNHTPRVDITHRRSILESIDKALNTSIYPGSKKILDRVAHPFLRGTISGMYQLEKCMIELSKSLDLSPATFKHFVRSVICHFQYYYDDQLPAAFKHPSDVYNSPLYTSRRIWEETEWLADPPLPDTSLETSNVPQSRTQTIPHTSPTITPVLKRSASLESENKENTNCKRRRPKKNTPESGPPAEAAGLKIVVYNPARPKRQRKKQ